MFDNITVLLLAPFSLLFPGFCLIRLIKFKLDNFSKLIAFSYLFSLALILIPLYVGGLTSSFNLASTLVWAITIVSIIFTLFLVIKDRTLILQTMHSWFSSINLFDFVTILIVIALLFIYIIFLLNKAILDSDVVHVYLPVAREIFLTNQFTYSTGYDYNVYLYPIGISVIYAFIYTMSGSIYYESFRLVPIISILVSIFLVYGLSILVTKNRKIANIAVIVYSLFPIHDRMLLYNSFYPDTFYMPLFFLAIYLVFLSLKQKSALMYLLLGIDIGIAFLFKAQAIFLVITVLVLLVFINIKNNLFKGIACILLPFMVVIYDVISHGTSTILNVNESLIQIILFLTGINLLAFFYLKDINAFKRINKLSHFSKNISLLLIPMTAISGLYYLTNYLKFGSVLYTSSISIPNLNWATNIIQSISPQPILDLNLIYGLQSFIFAYLDPAVMGFVWFIPFMIGLLYSVKKGTNENKVLLYFVIIFLIILFLRVLVIYLETGIFYINPRDLYPLALPLSIIVAVGLYEANIRLFSDAGYKMDIAILCYVLYFGSLSLIQSVLFSYYPTTNYSKLIEYFVNIFDISLKEISLQIVSSELALSIHQNFTRFLVIGLLSGLPLIVQYAVFLIFNPKKFMKKIQVVSDQLFRLFKVPIASYKVPIALTLVIAIISMVIILPRIVIITTGGGFSGFKENQLQIFYGPFSELIENHSYIDGSILTYRAPGGLPYYLPGIKIIDLQVPANLAFLKDCLLSNSPNETVAKMSQMDISYLLINPYITRELDIFLNFTILKIIREPELAIQIERFGSWYLYALGLYSVEKTFMPLTGWSIDERYTNAPYSFNNSESTIFLELYPKDSDSRVTIVNHNIPKLDLSKYDYVITDIEGSENAKVQIRFMLDGGGVLDVAYWKDPYVCSAIQFDLKPYHDKKLSGALYIGLKSSDGSPSFIKIINITFIKIES